MIKLKLLLILYFNFCLGLVAYSQNSLVPTQKKIQGIIENVEDSKNKYEQSWEFTSTSPKSVIYTRNEIDVKKANTTKNSIEINLALLNEKSNRVKKSKELYSLVIKSDKIATIKFKENDDAYEFRDKFVLYFADESSAMQCDSLLKIAIVESKKLFDAENELPKTYNDLSQYISSRVINFQANDLLIEQSFEYDSKQNDIVNFAIKEKEKGENQTETSSQFSLGDLDPEKVRLKTANDHFSISLNTKQKQPFIESKIINKQDKEYSTELDLLFGSPEAALLVVKALEKQIELAKAKLDQRLIVFDSEDEARTALSSAIGAVDFQETNRTQLLEFDNYKAIYASNSPDKKSTYEFYFEDFDDDLNLSFKGGSIKANPRTINKLKYVKLIENGVIKGYDKDFSFYLSDIESMRKVSRAISYLYENSSLKVTAKDLAWLSNKAEQSNTKEFSQSLIFEEDKKCAVKLKVQETENTIEQTFALYDLNAQSIEISPKGKELVIGLSTVESYPLVLEKSKEKEEKRVKSVSLVFSDILDAKIAKKTLFEEIESCTKYMESSEELKEERDSLLMSMENEKKENRTKVFKNGPYFEKKSYSFNLSAGLFSNVDLKETAIFNDAFETRILIPGLQLTYERQVWKNFGLGLSLGTQMWRVTGGGASDKYGTLTYRYAAMATRATYHFNLSKKIDPYIGATASVRMMYIASGSNSLQARFDFRPSWLVGVKYYYSKHLGLFIEGGDENINWLRIGFTYYN